MVLLCLSPCFSTGMNKGTDTKGPSPCITLVSAMVGQRLSFFPDLPFLSGFCQGFAKLFDLLLLQVYSFFFL